MASVARRCTATRRAIVSGGIPLETRIPQSRTGGWPCLRPATRPNALIPKLWKPRWLRETVSTSVGRQRVKPPAANRLAGSAANSVFTVTLPNHRYRLVTEGRLYMEPVEAGGEDIAAAVEELYRPPPPSPD